MYKLNIENGCYIFKLDDMLKQKNISINQLMKDTNTDFKVIKRIMTGNLVKWDIFVLALFGGGTLLFGVIHLFQNFIARK